jgi:uncharacterized iron-regulated membrane protein
MKDLFRTIHLYLGLAAGLVIATTCFTGAVLVFEKELQYSIYPERYKTEIQEKRAELQQLLENFRKDVPNGKVSSVKTYADPERTVELSYTIAEAAPKEKTDRNTENKKPEPGKGGGNSVAFMDPYTGGLISLYTHRNSFFYTMFALHRWLLAGDTGKLIVGISTSIFLFILLTGIILWWPKNMKKLKNRIKLKWNAGWKRINHDLHITIGFYSAIFLFIIAFTGLAWSFQWFNDAIYWITGTENIRQEPPLSSYKAEASTITYDEALMSIRARVPDAVSYAITMPRDSAGAIAINVMSQSPAHEKASDQYFLDQYTGQVIGTALYSDRNLGQRVRSSFYPIHVGSIAGLPGRVIAFLVCVAGVTFPVTGVILWLNRLKKGRKKKKKKTHNRSGEAHKTLSIPR